MFGYVIANTKALTTAQYTRYRAAYCGLCECLKENYGNAGRLCLQYDFVFLILTLSSLSADSGKNEVRRCAAHPFRAHQSWQGKITRYAADLNILLAYYKLLDDQADEGSLGLRIKALKPSFERALAAQPEKAAFIKETLAQLSEIEARGEQSPDTCANTYAALMGEMFVYDKNNFFAATIRELGEALGRFVYIADAVCDLPKDLRRDVYNPLLAMHNSGAGLDEYRRILTNLIAECAAAFEKLPIDDDYEILANIIYSGVFIRIDAAEQKSKSRNGETK